MGTSQYTNCEGTEMEVDIACVNKGNTAADGTPTKEICSYSDQPVLFDDEAPATAAAGCGDHRSFDPKTHLIRDHATSRCRLNFVALADSCDAAPAEAGASSKFGVMVEAPLRTGPGAHDNHEPNEDKNPKDNNGLLLRFSTNGGATYYNNQYPRKTVRLDRSSPRRTLDNTTGDVRPCLPACARTDKFSGESTTTHWGENHHFETCYQHKDEAKFCWSKSYKHGCFKSTGGTGGDFYQCIPSGFYGDDGWHEVFPCNVEVYLPLYRTYCTSKSYSCGEPCQEMYHAPNYRHNSCLS